MTADGGFDYSSDFNGQEINSCQIILSECYIALNILKKHGTFVCKVLGVTKLTAADKLVGITATLKFPVAFLK